MQYGKLLACLKWRMTLDYSLLMGNIGINHQFLGYPVFKQTSTDSYTIGKYHIV